MSYAKLFPLVMTDRSKRTTKRVVGGYVSLKYGGLEDKWIYKVQLQSWVDTFLPNPDRRTKANRSSFEP